MVRLHDVPLVRQALRLQATEERLAKDPRGKRLERDPRELASCRCHIALPQERADERGRRQLLGVLRALLAEEVDGTTGTVDRHGGVARHRGEVGGEGRRLGLEDALLGAVGGGHGQVGAQLRQGRPGGVRIPRDRLAPAHPHQVPAELAPGVGRQARVPRGGGLPPALLEQGVLVGAQVAPGLLESSGRHEMPHRRIEAAVLHEPARRAKVAVGLVDQRCALRQGGRDERMATPPAKRKVSRCRGGQARREVAAPRLQRLQVLEAAGDLEAGVAERACEPVEGQGVEQELQPIGRQAIEPRAEQRACPLGREPVAGAALRVLVGIPRGGPDGGHPASGGGRDLLDAVDVEARDRREGDEGGLVGRRLQLLAIDDRDATVGRVGGNAPRDVVGGDDQPGRGGRFAIR